MDPACRHPFEANHGAEFIEADIATVNGDELAKLYPKGAVRLLAGCAPCSPFSPFRHGEDTSADDSWGLLRHFGRLVEELRPELVTMENVPGLGSRAVFEDFVTELETLDYEVVWGSLYCPRYRVPQHRRRLVLLASSIGSVALPAAPIDTETEFKTVRDAIGSLPALKAGEADPRDPLHRARSVSEINLRRLRASRPGGTWHDWPTELRAPCHRRPSGSTFRNVYSRMSWDEPAPTITTQAFNFGTGRFGHPEQDRSLTLREAALLQTFPRRYEFAPPGEAVAPYTIGRLIGNAVPPRLAYYIGKELVRVSKAHAQAA